MAWTARRVGEGALGSPVGTMNVILLVSDLVARMGATAPDTVDGLTSPRCPVSPQLWHHSSDAI